MSQTPVRPIKAFATQLLGIPIRYIRKVKWADEILGFEMARALWAGGAMPRLGLLALIGGTAASAWLVWRAASEAAPSPVPLPSLVVGMIMVTLGWAFALTAGVRWSLAGFTALAAYLAWYGLLIGMGMMRSPAFAMPILWMLALGWWMARHSPRRSRYAWLLLLCAGAGWLLFTPFNLNARFADEWNTPARFALTGLLFVALAAPVALSKPKAGLIHGGTAFLGTIVIVGGFYALAARADLSAMQENAVLAMDGLMGAVSLFWLWLGAGAVDGALKVGEFASREWIDLVRKPWASWVIPGLWALAAIMGAWLLVRPPSWGGMAAWVDRWPDSVYFSVRGQTFVSLAAIAAALIAAALRRVSARLLSWLNGLWVAAFLIQLGYYNRAFSLATFETRDLATANVWPALLLVGGLTWQLAKGGAEWTKASEGRRLGWVAVLLWLLGAVTILLSAGTPLVQETIALYSFQGIVYLGLPVLIYNALRQVKSIPLIEGSKLAVLFGIGWLSALPVLRLGVEAGAPLAVAPLAWAAVLAVAGSRLAPLARPMDVAVAGGAMALGFVTGWLSPQLIPIPFFRATFDWQMAYLSQAWARPNMDALQWPLTGVALVSGLVVSLPYATSSRWRFALRLVGALAGALILGLTATRLSRSQALAGIPPAAQELALVTARPQVQLPPPRRVASPTPGCRCLSNRRSARIQARPLGRSEVVKKPERGMGSALSEMLPVGEAQAGCGEGVGSRTAPCLAGIFARIAVLRTKSTAYAAKMAT